MRKIFYMGKEYAGFTDNAMDMTNPKIDLASYGTSPTSGGTTTKVVTTNGGNFERVNGAYVVVTFDNANTGSVSLNVDGTGSKYAYYNGSRLNDSNGNFSAGETVTFMYDGTYYQRLDTDTDDTSILKSLANLGWSDVLSSGLLIVKKLLAKLLKCDFVIEEGTSGIWTYRKWASGIAECWGVDARTRNLSSGYGSSFYTTGSVTLPTNFFKSIINVQISRAGADSGAGVVYVSTNNVSTSEIGFFIGNAISFSGNIAISITVRGRWK